MLIHNKDDIEFVTEFPCLLGHPVSKNKDYNLQSWFKLISNLIIPFYLNVLFQKESPFDSHRVQDADPDFSGDSRMSQDDLFFGYGRQIFCAPYQPAQQVTFSTYVRTATAPPSSTISAPCW